MGTFNKNNNMIAQDWGHRSDGLRSFITAHNVVKCPALPRHTPHNNDESTSFNISLTCCSNGAETHARWELSSAR
jgi:hypothetical protein